MERAVFATSSETKQKATVKKSRLFLPPTTPATDCSTKITVISSRPADLASLGHGRQPPSHLLRGKSLDEVQRVHDRIGADGRDGDLEKLQVQTTAGTTTELWSEL